MAKELSRTFHMEHGAVVVRMQDENGSVSSHTVYVRGVSDVNEAIKGVHSAVDSAAKEIKEKFTAAGWNGNQGS